METEEPLRVEFGFLLGDPDPLPGWLVHLFLLLEGYRVGPIFLIGNISIIINNNSSDGNLRSSKLLSCNFRFESYAN